MAINPSERYRQKSELYDKIGSWCLGGTCLLGYLFIATIWASWGPGHHNQLLKAASYKLIVVPAVITACFGIASKRFELKSEGKDLHDLMPWK